MKHKSIRKVLIYARFFCKILVKIDESRLAGDVWVSKRFL
jgi:hypothetical protein